MRPLAIARGTYLAARGAIVGTWYRSNNWGDALNPYLLHRLSKRKAVHEQDVPRGINKHFVYAVVGSILQNIRSNNVIVWGAGFVEGNRRMHMKPRQVCAVRGPLSRGVLLKQGIDCPEVYGDPALLMPLLYEPPRPNTRFRLGIIPHYVDQGEPWLRKISQRDDISIINVKSDITAFIDSVAECDAIASSSLHGLIVADAYAIPNIWIKLSDSVSGYGFKFRDYFASVNRGKSTRRCIQVRDDTQIDEVVEQATQTSLHIRLDDVIEACPFINARVRYVIITEMQRKRLYQSLITKEMSKWR